MYGVAAADTIRGMYVYCTSTACVCRWTAAAAACCCFKYMLEYVGPAVSAIEMADLGQVLTRL